DDAHAAPRLQLDLFDRDACGTGGVWSGEGVEGGEVVGIGLGRVGRGGRPDEGRLQHAAAGRADLDDVHRLVLGDLFERVGEQGAGVADGAGAPAPGGGGGGAGAA